MKPRLHQAAPAEKAVLLIADDIGIFLAVARSLGRCGIAVDVATPDQGFPGLQSRYVRHVRTVPGYLSQPEEWAQRIAELVRQHGYDWIVPTSDSSLILLEQQRTKIDQCKLAIPNQKAFETFTDKAATRRFADQIGVRMAQGHSIPAKNRSADAVKGLSLPIVLKPLMPYHAGDRSAKTAAIIVRDAEDIGPKIRELGDRAILAEEFFTGEGVGVSVLAKDGVILRTWQHRRLAAVSDTGRSCRRVGEAINPRLLRDVELLCSASELTGVAMFEFRVNDAACEHILIEVNPRFWGSLPLAVASGADIPIAYWRMSQGEGLSFCSGQHRTGVIKTDLSGEYERLTADLKPLMTKSGLKASAGLIGLGLKCLVSQSEFDSWAADDRKPFSTEAKRLAKLLLAALHRRIQWRSNR